MTEVSFNLPDHPPALTLASLARGELSENERETQARHLARCRRCMAIFAEFVEQSLGNDPPAAPRAWLDQGMALPQSTRDRVASAPRQRNWKWAWGTALLSGVALALIFLAKIHAPEAVPRALQATLIPELRADSQGSLVYADDVPPEPRGVRGSTGSSSSAGLDELLEIYRARPSDAEAAYWLIATYLATNQLRNADPFLREAMDKFPNDSRFLNLAAILAYKENRLQDAEHNLRNAAAKERNATVLVNLAIVRRQQGDEAGAEALLGEAQSRFPNSALSKYIHELAADR